MIGSGARTIGGNRLSPLIGGVDDLVAARGKIGLGGVATAMIGFLGEVSKISERDGRKISFVRAENIAAGADFIKEFTLRDVSAR